MKAASRWIPPVLTGAEAAGLIPDGSCLIVSGFGYAGVANTVHSALAERFRREGSPGGLTYIHAAGQTTDRGGDLLTREGLVTRIIGGHWGAMNCVRAKIAANELEAHNWPQGVLVKWFQALARGEEGLISPIGLGTCIDPRRGGGCMNDLAGKNGSLIRLHRGEDGTEKLCYLGRKVDFAIVRGWEADRLGNVALGREALDLGIRDFAMAARASGGKVICQVRQRDLDSTFSFERIALPGFLIDALVICDDPENDHRQSLTFENDSCLLEFGFEKLPPVLPGPRGWIGRRAAREIREGDIYNVGIGIPGDTVTAALIEAGRLDEALPTLESGVVGGVGMVNDFGPVVHPYTRVDQAAMFDLYYSGNLDAAFMGAAEIAPNGDINVSKFGGRGIGCGGFIDITQSARRIIFCSTLTGGGLEAIYGDGRVKIIQEGRQKKFLREIQQVTFSGSQTLACGREAMLITERCVFCLDEEGWTLTEVAPGIDPEREIFPLMEFRPLVAPDCREMPEECFAPHLEALPIS